jgi:hypothetical protein
LFTPVDACSCSVELSGESSNDGGSTKGRNPLKTRTVLLKLAEIGNLYSDTKPVSRQCPFESETNLEVAFLALHFYSE